jgi:hypothetical protein
MMIRAPTGRMISHYGYPAVGRCIYCDSTQGKLTTEHIIAKGIGGNVTLAGASCGICSAITGEIERLCFLNMLGAFRTQMGFPTRHPKDRPKELPLTIIHVDKRVEIKDVSIPDHPAMLLMPAFSEMPHVLLGRAGESACSLWTYIANPDTVKKHPDGTMVGGTPFQLTFFCRMLAKLAHAFAAADAGLNTFTPILPDFILGKSTVAVDWLIGCATGDTPPKEDVLHRVSLDIVQQNSSRFLVAKIRLFAKFGAPEYYVAVGPLL